MKPASAGKYWHGSVPCGMSLSVGGHNASVIVVAPVEIVGDPAWRSACSMCFPSDDAVVVRMVLLPAVLCTKCMYPFTCSCQQCVQQLSCVAFLRPVRIS